MSECFCKCTLFLIWCNDAWVYLCWPFQRIINKMLSISFKKSTLSVCFRKELMGILEKKIRRQSWWSRWCWLFWWQYSILWPSQMPGRGFLNGGLPCCLGEPIPTPMTGSPENMWLIMWALMCLFGGLEGLFSILAISALWLEPCSVWSGITDKYRQSRACEKEIPFREFLFQFSD